MQVLVRTLEGKTLAFAVEHSETVADLVARVTSEVAPATGACSLALSHRGKKLADTSTFETLQLKDRAMLLLSRAPSPASSPNLNARSPVAGATTATAAVSVPALSRSASLYADRMLATALTSSSAPMTSLTSIALSSGFTSRISAFPHVAATTPPPPASSSSSSSSATAANTRCPASTEATPPPTVPNDAASPPTSPCENTSIQTDLSRCWKCSKKLGLLKGTRCRCGFLFCEKHRYNMGPFSHECTYDYKTEAQIKLRKLNPKIDSIKIDNKIV